MVLYISANKHVISSRAVTRKTKLEKMKRYVLMPLIHSLSCKCVKSEFLCVLKVN